MELTITLPADAEPRVLDALCGMSGHTPCGNQPECAQTQLLGLLSARVTDYERLKARQAAAANVPPLTLGG